MTAELVVTDVHFADGRWYYTLQDDDKSTVVNMSTTVPVLEPGSSYRVELTKGSRITEGSIGG